MAVNLSDNFPIYDITNKGLIIGDNKGSITACFELSLPIVFTLGSSEYSDLIESFRKFLELLGEEVVVHLQTFYHREYFSLINSNEDFSSDLSKTEEFINRAYQMHFNERPYLCSKSYMYISKLPSDSSSSITKSLIGKDFLKTEEQTFIDNILNSINILKKFGIDVRKLDQDELIGAKSPISKYINFSSSDIEELKDIDFSNNRIFIGSKEVKIFSIQEEEQFPTTNITYNRIENGIPVSNMYPFSYALGIPHILNQYIYIPNQKKFRSELEARKSRMTGFNVKGANDSALTDILTFEEKMNDFGSMGVYFHTNIMCFDASDKDIEESINTAFSETGFKKKEPTLSRKDIFWGGVAGNGSLLVSQKKDLMCTLLDIESCAFLNLETNYNNTTSNTKGVRLCDRIYGIPFEVDLYNLPKKKGMIKNENTIVLAGSGGGKSFTMNLVLLNEYLQGNHIFIIDASFSYKLQCAMHDGVYLTYDDKEKISFNPFYMDWLLEKDARLLFTSKEIERYDYIADELEIKDENVSIESIITYSMKHSEKVLPLEDRINEYRDYLENKISVLIGILSTITKGKDEILTKFERSVYRALLFNYFKDRCLTNKVNSCKFDDFYFFMEEFLPKFLEEKNIDRYDFNYNTFKLSLETFTSSGSLGYLLNSEDPKIKNIANERFVVIDVSKIRENADLFPIISALAMDLYNQKVAKLPVSIKKILCIDEAWQAISSPDMATFMKTQVKVIRKYGGRTVFITQEPDDFIASDIIKESIINNSSIKFYLDMGEFKQKFEPIKKILAISDNNESKIKSLNQNNRKDAFYREVCICWENYGQVYAVETPLELKAIFETDPDEVGKILPQYDKYGVYLTATNYANR